MTDTNGIPSGVSITTGLFDGAQPDGNLGLADDPSAHDAAKSANVSEGKCSTHGIIRFQFIVAGHWPDRLPAWSVQRGLLIGIFDHRNDQVSGREV